MHASLKPTLDIYIQLRRKTARLFVDNTHGVDWNKKAFDRLVLDQKLKDMIRALVDVQITAGKMEDIITGKGNGLVRTRVAYFQTRESLTDMVHLDHSPPWQSRDRQDPNSRKVGVS